MFRARSTLRCCPGCTTNGCHIVLGPLGGDVLPHCRNRQSGQIIAIYHLGRRGGLPLTVSTFTRFHAQFYSCAFRVCNRNTLRGSLGHCTISQKINSDIRFYNFQGSIRTYVFSTTVFIVSSSFRKLSGSVVRTVTLKVPAVTASYPVNKTHVIVSGNMGKCLIPIQGGRHVIATVYDVTNSANIRRHFDGTNIQLHRHLSISSVSGR